MWLTGRMSPDSATSPITATSGGIGMVEAAEATARHTARSVAGSLSRAPPTVATKTSRSSLSPASRSVTASSIATRDVSRPVTPRRGLPDGVAATSACTSAGTARRPSTDTATAVPGTGTSRALRNSDDGSGTSRSPSSACSKHTTSSAGP
jgi:hypothetical protein